MTTNLLVYAGLNSNSLERALRLNAPEYSTISKLLWRLDKRYYVITVGRDEKKQSCIRTTQYKSDYPFTKRFLHHNKTLNYFKAENKLYRHD